MFYKTKGLLSLKLSSCSVFWNKENLKIILSLGCVFISLKNTLYTFTYAPKTIVECTGNDEARGVIKTWALDWQRDVIQKPLLIYGPTGSGKTAIAQALSLEMDWPLFNLDFTTAIDLDKLKQQLTSSAQSIGLFSKYRLFLIDEVDGPLSRGIMPLLTLLAKENKQPIIFIANDAWDQKLSSLRTLCKLVEIKKINSSSISKTLHSIALKSNLQLSEEEISAISKNSNGDIRAAIVDIQSGQFSERDKESDVFKTVSKIFKAQTISESLEIADTADVDLSLLIRWLEENIADEYEKADEIAKSFNWLSRADVFNGRILRKQQWQLFVYYRFLSIAGIASAKNKPYYKFVKYRFPTYVKTLSTSRAKRNALKEVAEVFSTLLHCSKSQALEALFLLPLTPQILSDLKINEDTIAELSFLFGQEKIPKKTKSRIKS